MDVDQVHPYHLLSGQIHSKRIILNIICLDQTALPVVLTNSNRLYLRLIDVFRLMFIWPALVRVNEVIWKLLIHKKTAVDIFATDGQTVCDLARMMVLFDQAWFRRFMNNREISCLGLLAVPLLGARISGIVIELSAIITIRLFSILISRLLLQFV